MAIMIAMMMQMLSVADHDGGCNIVNWYKGDNGLWL